MGGGAPGYATFQGLPKQGGSLGYVGTPETAGMTQDQATAYNVGNINRQYEAMRALNEARAQAYGGGQQGTAGGLDVQDLMRLANPFYAPGQSYGDEVLNRDRFMRQFDGGPSGKGLKYLAAAEQGLNQAQAGRLQALGQIEQAMAALRQKQEGISPYQWGQLANDRARLSLDQGRYQAEAQDRAATRQATLEQKAKEYASKLPKEQLQQKTNEILDAYYNAVTSNNAAEAAKLKPLAELFSHFNMQTDLASYLQPDGR